MQTYKDRKLTCDVFLCSLSSYNFVIYILSQLNIHKSNSFFPLKNHHINSSNNLSYDFSRLIKPIWGSLLTSLYLSFNLISTLRSHNFFNVLLHFLHLAFIYPMIHIIFKLSILMNCGSKISKALTLWYLLTLKP